MIRKFANYTKKYGKIMKLFKIVLTTMFIMFFSLSPQNLFSGKTETDESILLPPTYGWFIDGELNISVHAWIFELEEDSILRNGFIKLLNNNFKNAVIDEKKIFEDRIRYFLVDNHRGKDIIINITGKEFSLPKTLPNGHTFSTIKIKDQTVRTSESDWQSFSTLPGDKGTKAFIGSFQIISEKGYSIISDIDDTIKESNVLNKNELVKNTFFRKFVPVKGMPELYKKFHEKGFVFHYVSGSPWQLYPAIHSFLIDEHFPEGAMELKLFRVKDKSLINFLSADQFTYKINSIKTILDRFPQRKFILIGDSGEKDPEVYAEIANQYKERIKYIFIRDAGLIDENSSRRKTVIEKAGNVKLVIFKDPRELDSFILNL